MHANNQVRACFTPRSTYKMGYDLLTSANYAANSQQPTVPVTELCSRRPFQGGGYPRPPILCVGLTPPRALEPLLPRQPNLNCPPLTPFLSNPTKPLLSPPHTAHLTSACHITHTHTHTSLPPTHHTTRTRTQPLPSLPRASIASVSSGVLLYPPSWHARTHTPGLLAGIYTTPSLIHTYADCIVLSRFGT